MHVKRGTVKGIQLGTFVLAMVVFTQNINRAIEMAQKLFVNQLHQCRRRGRYEP